MNEWTHFFGTVKKMEWKQTRSVFCGRTIKTPGEAHVNKSFHLSSARPRQTFYIDQWLSQRTLNFPEPSMHVSLRVNIKMLFIHMWNCRVLKIRQTIREVLIDLSRGSETYVLHMFLSFYLIQSKYVSLSYKMKPGVMGVFLELLI